MESSGKRTLRLVLTAAFAIYYPAMAVPEGQTVPQSTAALAAQTAPQIPAGGRGRGRGGDPFAGQPRIKALVVSGGCCHDYPLQARVIMDAISRAAPVDWMVAVQGGRGTTGHLPVYESPGWAKGFDIVVHNECFADITEPAFIRRITAAHRSGVPAMVIHCAMHTFRAATIDDWRELLGVTSRRHTKQFNIPVRIVAKDHAVMKGFKEDWVTPFDELYVIDKLWPGATTLAAAVSPEDRREYPLAWANDYHGARVFGTTLGHGNATFEDPVFQDLLARGFKWAVKRQ
jgi:type 1 glutamine amidotransferase